MERKPWRLSNITLKDVMDTEGGFEVAILPFGSTEPHNYHLPYATDTLTCTAITDLACAKAWDAGAKVVVLPPVTAGSNAELLKFPMVIHWSSLTYESIIRDVVASLKAHGIRKLLLVNGHGGNMFQHILQELVTDREIFIFQANWWEFAPKALEENSEKPGGHAHEWETSVAMHLFPELVKLEWATAGESNESSLSAINEGKIHLAYPWHLFTNNSGCGDPSLATPEKGRKITEAVVEEFSKFLVEFNNAELTDRFPY